MLIDSKHLTVFHAIGCHTIALNGPDGEKQHDIIDMRLNHSGLIHTNLICVNMCNIFILIPLHESIHHLFIKAFGNLKT